MPEFSRLIDVLILPGDRYGKQLRPIVELIDSIHRIETTHRLPVRITKNRQNEGEYHYKRGSFNPDFIEISRINDSMEATLLHEVGHFLELAVIPGCSYGNRDWTTNGLMAGWLVASQASAAFERLQQASKAGRSMHLNSQLPTEPPRPVRESWVSYLLTPRELWARSYTQWIAERGNHAILNAHLEKYCHPTVPIPLQWDRGDFAPIGKRLDQIFAELGWLR